MDFANLHELLRSTYEEMMPLCSEMTGIAKGIAGLGALFYIALRVWSSLSRAEPIDVFPLLRPFVLGFCIMFFPTIVLGTMNAVLSPVVQGTEKMVHVQQDDLQALQLKRDRLEEEAYKRDKSRAYLVDDEAWNNKIEEMGFIGPEDAITLAGMYAERTAFNAKRWFIKKVYQLLELLFHAVSLVIDTLRTFFLIVLSILGPIVFGIAVWDGLSGSLTAWFSRYISVYLWLPVSSILTALLTKIQILMLNKEIAQLQDVKYMPDSGNWYYIVFFLIGILGFFSVPTVSGWIIEAGGGIGNYGKNVNEQAKRAGGKALTGGKVLSAAGGAVVGNALGRFREQFRKGSSGGNTSESGSNPGGGNINGALTKQPKTTNS
ncbi:conjugative transposon protein TraJ [Porphyromonas gingivalis]|uniref:conjugative transposon protein TraJ n=1 Tax=Porphyromonas gingivalis TaxID=837 RepID=UPI00102958CC|nr:conjugative transposon protein TraJ [Porphyromonas gingivalis]RZQ68033.1 conjugative transposon protein TraJ [Porphyromonas gingivalis]